MHVGYVNVALAANNIRLTDAKMILPISDVERPILSISRPDSTFPGKFDAANNNALKYTFSKWTFSNIILIHVNNP